MTATLELARFVAASRLADIPDSVQHEAERALLAVGTHQHHGAREVGILQQRRGDEQAPGEQPWFVLPPLNEVGGVPRLFYIGWYLRDAQRHAEVPRLTSEQLEAMAMVERLANDPQVACHGDVHPGNVLPTAEGPVLIDWDLRCRAPIGWDHCALMTWAERWDGAGLECRGSAWAGVRGALGRGAGESVGASARRRGAVSLSSREQFAAAEHSGQEA